MEEWRDQKLENDFGGKTVLCFNPGNTVWPVGMVMEKFDVLEMAALQEECAKSSRRK
jgi:hypothetical protein